MTREDIEKIRLLSSKERLEKAHRYKMDEKEREELKKLTEAFEVGLENSIPKAIFYMRNFLGISNKEIAKILNFTYGTVRIYYATASCYLLME